MNLTANDSANGGDGQPRWQQKLAEAIRDPAELLDQLDLPASLLDGARAAARLFPLRVPRDFVALMRPGDPQDPLLRQVLPVAGECQPTPGYHDDAVGDGLARAAPGLLHKYHGRVLLLATASCAINCRYCFRRNYDYAGNRPVSANWREALDYIASDPDITEVILSGGDPLLLSDRQLHRLLTHLDTIPHLRRVRIHSRLPIVLPSRIDDGLLTVLHATRLQVVVVVHANHPRELSDDVGQAMASLKHTGVTLLNQSVLLAGINDDIDTLAGLSTGLFEINVLPYYLHLPDRVSGTAHFTVDREHAKQLHDELSAHLPGYLVPRLVEEIAGQPAKRLL